MHISRPISRFNVNSMRRELAAEASSIGLAPGQWPETIDVVRPSDALPISFVRTRYEKDAAGEFAGMVYSSPVTGWTLVLVND